MAQPRETRPGRVFLVGAGPGDPGLITLRGAACLRRADLVLYDYLVNPLVLSHAREGVEAVCLGRHSTERTTSQEEIHARMVHAARQGKTVVRLKGGSPEVFGHGAEEVEALRDAGILYEVVPGVSAGLAAAGYAGIPVTHGRHCSAVALVTGHERRLKAGLPLDYEALARFPGTLIVYMGVTTAQAWSTALLRGGRPPATPVAIVRRCTWADQQTVRCDLASLARVIAEKRVRPPAVIVVGEVVSLAPEVSWFAARPLFGQRVLVARPCDQAGAVAAQLAELGAEAILQPAIRISDPPEWAPVDRALAQIGRYSWLVFSSSNGVRYLLDRLLTTGGDARRLGAVKLAAMGPGTAAELGRYGLRADLLPEEYRAESLAAALAGRAAGKSVLLARASRGREVLAEQLRACGAAVEQVVVYTSSDVDAPEPAVAEAMGAGRIDWAMVTSSAIARSLVRMFGDDLRRARLASISPITSEVLRGLGHEPAVEAAEYTMAGLIEAIGGERPVAEIEAM